MVISGAVTFRIGDETRELGPGETWTIPSNVPHEATAGPEGAVLIDVFAPIRQTGSLSSRRIRVNRAGRRVGVGPARRLSGAFGPWTRPSGAS